MLLLSPDPLYPVQIGAEPGVEPRPPLPTAYARCHHAYLCPGPLVTYPQLQEAAPVSP